MADPDIDNLLMARLVMCEQDLARGIARIEAAPRLQITLLTDGTLSIVNMDPVDLKCLESGIYRLARDEP